MKTFNIDVRFTPAYHAASNGAIERRHQTIKNALKASLVDVGHTQGDQWTKALLWVLLGKGAAFQQDLKASASLLAFGRSPLLPGQLLEHPGPPLTSDQTKSLLEELYKMEAKPAIQTTSITHPIDISNTENATHVYVKVEDPKGLCSRFEGPYEVISRPSRSQLEVRLGSFAKGDPRLQVYHWSSCKIAHMREVATSASRPSLGRRPRVSPGLPATQGSKAGPRSGPSVTQGSEGSSDNTESDKSVSQPEDLVPGRSPSASGKIPEFSRCPARSTRNP